MNGKRAKVLRRASERVVGDIIKQTVARGGTVTDIPPPHHVYRRIKKALKRGDL